MSRTTAEILAELYSARFDFATGTTAAEKCGGRVVSDREDLNRVVCPVYEFRRADRLIHYVYRSGPFGYEWHLITWK